MTSKVAIVESNDDDAKALSRTIQQIGGIDELNTSETSVVVKVGVFSHRATNHTSVDLVKAIVDSFYRAPKVLLAESDNYQGNGLERLQLWKKVFTEKVTPVNLSDEKNTRRVTLAGQEMNLSDVLFKPNVLVSTHILRSFERGSILKNLFGCVPSPKKAKYHKILSVLLADIYEAIGGIDLAVLDGTFFWRGAGDLPIRMNTLLVGKDAVAVEAVGGALAGLKLEKMPVLQEFVRRGLGEGDLRNIEVVGASLKTLKPKFKLAAKQHRKKWRERGGAPKMWAPAIDGLIEEGFFKLPNKRTREDIRKALKAKSVPVEGNMNLVVATLTRRVKKGMLEAKKEPEGWIYWTE
ncbi:MAG: DUF362 domain-containing protein [Candidatus Bathyarchaeota archaeon]|nr:DUF362 domain-containing protein [Candidatus Bathyarchaeota archaeon]MDH5787649.1 DUF362 domain-containing protein [Candidatus Bathyarchaeota archaeon]